MVGRHGVGVVRGEGEDARHEGLLEGAQLADHVLQVGLVVDAPAAVVVVGAGVGRGFIFVAAIVFLEAEFAAKVVEGHDAVVATVEEGGVIAVVAEHGGEGVEAVVGVVGEGIGEVHECGQGGEDRGDALDGFFAVGAALVDDGVLGERVEEGGAGGHGAVVVAAHVFLSETFEDEDHHVFAVGDVGLGHHGVEGVAPATSAGCPEAGLQGVEHIAVLEAGVEEALGLVGAHVLGVVECAAVAIGANDVVEAVGDQRTVLALAVVGAGGPGGLGVAEGVGEEAEADERQDGAKDVVGSVVGVFDAGCEDDFSAAIDGEEQQEKPHEGGIPIVFEEMRPEHHHVATDAHVVEYLAAETSVGELEIGGVANIGQDEAQHRDIVEKKLDNGAECLVPATFERQQVDEIIGEEHQSHGDKGENDVAPEDAAPLGPAVDVEDAGVGKIEEHLGPEQQQYCQE